MINDKPTTPNFDDRFQRVRDHRRMVENMNKESSEKPNFDEHFALAAREKALSPDLDEGPKLFIVRLFDGMDGEWVNVSDAVSEEEATKIWNEKTENGTKKIRFDEIDYFRIFPADTVMKYSDGREMFRG